MFNNAGTPGPGKLIADITRRNGIESSQSPHRGIPGHEVRHPEMLKGGGGVIINVSSVAGVSPDATQGHTLQPRRE